MKVVRDIFGQQLDDSDALIARALLDAVLQGRVHAMVGYVVYTDGRGAQIKLGNAPHPLEHL